MKKKTLLKWGLTGLIAFTVRRLRWKAIDAKVDVSIARWIRDIFFVHGTCRSREAMIEYSKKTPIPKRFLYRATDIETDGVTYEHYYSSPRLFLINRVPVWIGRCSYSITHFDVYVLFWWWNRVKDVVLPWGKSERVRYNLSSIHTIQHNGRHTTGTSREIEWRSHVRTHGKLDTIPIHSEVRAKLDDHLASVNKAWDVDQNQYYSRNILLHGPKGTGKSHIAMALGVELGTDIYNFPVLQHQQDFLTAMNSIPLFTTLICDELQEIPQFNKKPLVVKSGDFSKRDALDTLSGMFSPLGVFSVYCTNDLSEIDDRINRNGRFKEVIFVGAVDDAGIKRWLKANHNYDVPEGVVLKEMFCMDIFDRMDKLDDPEAFVLENML